MPQRDVSNKPETQKKAAVRSSEIVVAGVGASAGGLAAFKTFIEAIHPDSGLAYIFQQHMDSSHESVLPELLQKVTKIPVQTYAERTSVSPNHIYVMPSDKVLVCKDGDLFLKPRADKLQEQSGLPINLLFSALATKFGSNAYGVVLTGTANDGTLGLKAIKEQGGVTFAQSVDSAAYKGMPESAIQSGVVDFILPPQEIPAKLLEISKRFNQTQSEELLHADTAKQSFDKALAMLSEHKGTNFTHYKQTTIRRRILRRMALCKFDTLNEYLAFLVEEPEEIDTLYQDLLIPVSSFFRDVHVFNKLSDTYLKGIVERRKHGQPLRIWVAGCSTGEEAYSLAMVLCELLEKETSGVYDIPVQIFASDLSEIAIQKARHGVYTAAEIADVSEERRQRFFTADKGGFRVKRQIRELCVFTVHDMLSDPPFGKVDLVSCRNVLIYFEPYLQKKALTTFHYVLNPGGLLLLGKSETTSGIVDLYHEIARGEKLFVRKDVPSSFVHTINRRPDKNRVGGAKSATSDRKSVTFKEAAEDILLKRFTPAGVVINNSFDIVLYRGKTSLFLEQSPGKPSHNLLTLAVQGLSFELRSLILKAKKDFTEVKKGNIVLRINNHLHTITLEVIPLPDTIEPYFLVLFHQERSDALIARTPGTGLTLDETAESQKDQRINQLELEIVNIREDVQTITEDQETVIDELQTANEELMSGSEELQSVNEELETSKEELQSTNEELIVLNKEMTSLNEQLHKERVYSESIVANIREPLLVLDQNLRIKTANNAFYKQFKLSEKETTGSMIFHLGNKEWDFPEIRTLLYEKIKEQPVIIDYRLIHFFPNVGELHLLLNARIVPKAESESALILLSLEDVTIKERERERKQELQEQYTKELEKLVEVRTAALRSANQKLLNTNMELMNMNKELNAFAYVSSHDLQEPLRKIQTFAGRITETEDEHLSSKGKAYFSRMQDAASRMQKLIDDLLTFSRLNAGERIFEVVHLEDVVQNVVSGLSEQITEKQATISVGPLCEARIIVFQFNQMLHNLLSNALKFSKQDVPAHITVKSRIIQGEDVKSQEASTGRSYCELVVADNGIGFESKFKEQIFEVFQKLHGKEEYPGTGIGLATVKKIVGHHNGFIHVRSAVDKGTSFSIYIPFDDYTA